MSNQPTSELLEAKPQGRNDVRSLRRHDRRYRLDLGRSASTLAMSTRFRRSDVRQRILPKRTALMVIVLLPDGVMQKACAHRSVVQLTALLISG